MGRIARLIAAVGAARAGEIVDGCDPELRAALLADWRSWAHDGQQAPPGDWRVWLILAGRGFGKTRSGAEWVRDLAEADCCRIALVGATLGEARRIMVEGDSGILAACDAAGAPAPQWQPSLRRLSWANGSTAVLFSAAEPEALRGPQHHHAWCDEIAKWDMIEGRADAVWDNLTMGLRLGTRPRILATTTPRATPLLRRLIADEGTVVTRGRMHDNRHLADAVRRDLAAHYAGTRIGRQELDGELIEDVAGALWSRALCAAAIGRGAGMRAEDCVRVVIAIDPPASATGDACGIVAAGVDAAGTALVIEDASVVGESPEGWARAAAHCAARWQADRCIAEANQGGDMVRSVLQAAGVPLPVTLVHARRGKAARAEPVAALYEQGRVGHAAGLALLEEQLCGLVAGGGYHGPGRSPDRADALVWALTALMLGQPDGPRVRVL